MSSLQDAIRSAGLKISVPNTTVDIAVTMRGDKFHLSANTWQGGEFLSVNADARGGEFTAESARQANRLSNEAARLGLNVTLCGKAYRGGQQ